MLLSVEVPLCRIAHEESHEQAYRDLSGHETAEQMTQHPALDSTDADLEHHTVQFVLCSIPEVLGESLGLGTV